MPCLRACCPFRSWPGNCRPLRLISRPFPARAPHGGSCWRETLLGPRVESEEFNSRSWKENFWRYLLWAYYRYIEMVDGQVGLILDALEDSGLAGNTLVIFSSDRGNGHTAHQLLYKGFLYDEACAGAADDVLARSSPGERDRQHPPGIQRGPVSHGLRLRRRQAAAQDAGLGLPADPPGRARPKPRATSSPPTPTTLHGKMLGQRRL